MLRWLLPLVLLAGAPQVAAAQSTACDYFAFGPSAATLGVATVVTTDPTGRVYFRDPAGSSAKPYLVAGDEVVTGPRAKGQVCAWFRPKRTSDAYGTVGWLPAAALKPLPPGPPPSADDWRGVWVRNTSDIDNAELTIRPRPGGWLALRGEAAFAHSDADARRGSINTGEIDQQVDVRGRLAGTLLPKAREPLGDYTCSIGLARVGDWLFATDNGDCGGVNVTFNGLYRRK